MQVPLNWNLTRLLFYFPCPYRYAWNPTFTHLWCLRVKEDMFSARFHLEVTVRPRIQKAYYKKWNMDWEAQTGTCQCSTSTFEDSCRYTALGHAGVKGNDRADTLARKVAITNGLHLGRSKVLRNLRHCLQAQSQRTSRHWSSGGDIRAQKLC